MIKNILNEIVECPNCGQETKRAHIFRIDGYTGCMNYVLKHIKPGASGWVKCYSGDLKPRVEMLKENEYEMYRNGYGVYRKDWVK